MGRRKSALRPIGRARKSEQPTAPGILLKLGSTRVVAAASRDTITLDLLGLESPSGPESQAASSGVDVGRSAKITLRLAPPVARKMAAQARAAGLSHGVYLSTLIAGAPADPDRRGSPARRGSADSVERRDRANGNGHQWSGSPAAARRDAFGRRGGSDLGGAVVRGPRSSPICVPADCRPGSARGGGPCGLGGESEPGGAVR